MHETSKALNVIGRPYNSVAVMLGRAFDYADEVMRASDSVRRAKRESLSLPVLTRPQLIAEYVDEAAADRRYKLKWGAATDSSAILTYMGVRYYIDSVYHADTKSRTHYVHLA